MTQRPSSPWVLAILGLLLGFSWPLSPIPLPAQQEPRKRLPRQVQRLLTEHRNRIARELPGGRDDHYVIALCETRYVPREPSFFDLVRGGATFGALMIDTLALPVQLLAEGDAFIVSSSLPPPPPLTERQDVIVFELIEGRQAAIDRVAGFTTEKWLAPAPVGEPPVYRSWGFVGAADAEVAGEAKMQVEDKFARFDSKFAERLEREPRPAVLAEDLGRKLRQRGPLLAILQLPDPPAPGKPRAGYWDSLRKKLGELAKP